MTQKTIKKTLQTVSGLQSNILFLTSPRPFQLLYKSKSNSPLSSPDISTKLWGPSGEILLHGFQHHDDFGYSISNLGGKWEMILQNNILTLYYVKLFKAHLDDLDHFG